MLVIQTDCLRYHAYTCTLYPHHTIFSVCTYTHCGVYYNLIGIISQEFLGKLMSQQFSCLHPFSSYQRRHMALSVLHLLSTIFPDTHNSITHHANTQTADESNDRGAVISSVFEFPSAVSGHQARRLVYALRDSYDANRMLVLELLCCLHKETLGLEVICNHLNTTLYCRGHLERDNLFPHSKYMPVLLNSLLSNFILPI